MIVRLRELRSNEAICRYDNIKKKEDDPMSSLKDKTVTMAHGAGGRQTSELIDQIFAAHFANPDLTADDAAVLTPPAGKWQYQQTDLSFHRHSFREEILVNFLSVEQSMILPAWVQNHSI